MKEVENEIKRLSDRLDAIRHQQAGLWLNPLINTRSWKRKRDAESRIIRLREVRHATETE